MMFMGVVMFLSGMLAFISHRKHVLNMLLSLEFIVLSLTWVMMSFLFCLSLYYMMLYFFVFAVCEAALGLSLIVILIRTYGSDLLLNLNLVQC